MSHAEQETIAAGLKSIAEDDGITLRKIRVVLEFLIEQADIDFSSMTETEVVAS